MQKYQRFLTHAFLPLLALALFCSSCSASTTSTVTPTPTQQVQSTQPVSAQEISTQPVVYVALGASDAVGVGTSQPGSEGYVPLVSAHLSQNSHAINLGISGIRLHEAINQELPIALSTSPQLITIWLVANDFVGGVPYDQYMPDLEKLLKQLRAGTQARIVIANLPDLTLLPALSGGSTAQKAKTRAEIQRWNAKISTIAKNYNVIVVDLFSKDSQLTAHPEYISGDGFHPSPAGYVQLANFFWNAIQANR
ncbi:SGNH/GDSL hydrolase family protein [Tengunoibacter tsumagoiensis]|uniref:Lipase/acylhydrolase n=1 Tax=Tengunoibacter tsumagoiensis TaxID=2014871 RepID=A0A402A546_9CHLR|nr:SGNH/GDSL hydrolase family protein [Tengunoibacter tsumagoiensis]GCE14273.1 lipase/acylhydrolase [Tengunoibacter tsumagoiensis]